ncbi:MAG: hypothetical protein H0T79_12755, partial [Deltaproteobacteria bacterium]|nr:hypothetical protein [Deltaproteobacteria bacterium]
PYTITGTAMFDVDASGGGTIQVISGPADDAITSPLGFGITVTPRTAMPLDSFTSNTLVLPFDSHLYEMTPATAPHIARFAVRSIETNASPRVAILPASGHFADLLSEAARSTLVATTPASSKYYAIYFDRRGSSGYVYDLTETSMSLIKTPEAEPNDTAGAAQALALPLLLDDADLSSQTDQDWVTVQVAASDIGKRIHVITTSNDPRTDTFVDVLGPTMTSLGGPSSDANFHEDFLSTPITAAGTHYIALSASQTIFFDPAHKDYVAAIFLE